MTKKNTPTNIQSSDRPYICQSACLTCQNKNNCRVIAKAVTNLSSVEVIRQSSPTARKKFAAIADHLRREGFLYPNVRHPSECWMHQKFGVATFYENQLVQLAEKMGQAGSISKQSDRVL